MYDYQFHKVELSALTGRPKEDYEQLIHDYAKEGWRLHTFAPLGYGAGGQHLAIQLIFEKEV